MKGLILITLLIPLKLFAQQAIVEEGHYVFDGGRVLLENISSQQALTIDHLGPHGYEVYGPQGVGLWLEQLAGQYNIDIIHIDQALQFDKNSEEAQKNYPSHEQITARLFELEKQHSDIMKVTSIGRSKNGRDLWSVKISSNVHLDEVKPEFKYIANMHGDEIVGRELMVMLIEDLLANYRSGNDYIRSLVDHTEIYIIPSMNPDGAANRRRGNANSVDLNRNFPDFTRGQDNHAQNRQPETQAVMAFQAARKFALSANFHGGTECVNYPWDSLSNEFPLTHLIRSLSIEYAKEVPGMANSRQFRDGVTNGYRWYPVYGGMQDWSYHWHNDLQVTIELSHQKWPNYQTIEQYYRWNRASMIRYIARIHQGAGFKLAQHKVAGYVSIEKLEGGRRHDLGRFSFGESEFYKVLDAGRYHFHIETHNGQKYSFETDVTTQEGDFEPNYVFLD